MAYDETNFLSTPEGYATPGQTAAVREYAKALLFGKGQQPVHHWTQGVSNIVNALVGGYDLYGAGRRDRESDLYDANKLPRDVGDKTQSKTAIAEGMIPPVQLEKPDLVPPTFKPRAERMSATPLPFGETPVTGSMYEGLPGWAPGERPIDAPGPGAALPFDGTPANLPPGTDSAPAAIARALAAGGKGMQPPFPPGGVATKAPVDPTGSFAVPPGLVPHRTPVTREEFVNSAASHRLMPEMKKDVFEKYYGQRQPLQMAVPGGSMIINSRNPSQQMFIPDISKSKESAGGTEEEVQSITVPDGKGGLVRKIIPVEEPGRAGRPQATPAPGKAPVPPSLDDTPQILKYAPEEGAAVEPPGMLGTAPPGMKAQAQLSDRLGRKLDDVTAREIAKKQQEHINTKDFDSFDKKYTAVTNAGEDAAKSMPMLALAKRVIEDPNYYSGIGADLVINYKRLMSQLGSDPNAAAANELFDKITSGAILGDMRATLQGLGQVRVAEIDLLSKAMANRYNSVPANRAVIDLMERSHKQADFLSSRATDYREGWRWDQDGKPYKTNEPPTYAGLSATMKRFIEKLPQLSDEKVKAYNFLFDKEGYDTEKYKKYKADLEAANSGKPAPTQAPAEPPPPPGTTRLPPPK